MEVLLWMISQSFLCAVLLLCIVSYARALTGLRRSRFTTTRTFASDSALSPSSSFSFGICADIQYVEAEDGANFQKTKIRRYMQSIEIFKEAVNSWKDTDSISFGLLLGDMIDQKASTLKTQDSAWESIMDIIEPGINSGLDFHYVFGNHEHYSFSRQELYSKFLREREDCSPEKLYYSFKNAENSFKFIALDAYDSSIIGASTPETLQQAKDLLAEKNPNDLSINGGWFNNLPRESLRYVPYNGGIGPTQLSWLCNELESAKKEDLFCVIFCHQPIHAPKKPQSVLWNAEEVKRVIRSHGDNRVVMWLAGHDHDGQYEHEVVLDTEEGKTHSIHHLVPPAPIECQVGETAYGHIDVIPDENKLVLNWKGRIPDSKYEFIWPKEMTLPTPGGNLV